LEERSRVGCKRRYKDLALNAVIEEILRKPEVAEDPPDHLPPIAPALAPSLLLGQGLGVLSMCPVYR
jgi:hypothetical protein